MGGSLSTFAAASAVAILFGKNFVSSRVFLLGGGTVVDEERMVCDSGERLRRRLGMGVGGGNGRSGRGRRGIGCESDDSVC